MKPVWRRCCTRAARPVSKYIRRRILSGSKRCHRSAHWSHAVIGIKEPVSDRRNGATA